MTSVTFPTRLGGSGATISDDADPNTGLLNGGHRDRFLPSLKGVVDMANYVYQYAAKVDAASDDADRADDARAYVETYANALRSNVLSAFHRRAALSFDMVRGRYLADDGELVESTEGSDLLEVNRSTPKWVIGPNARLRQVPAYRMAREWDPATGQPLGALIEGASTNLVTRSSAFDQSAWTVQSATISKVTGVAPDGSISVCRLVPSASNEVHGIRQLVTVDAGAYVTASVFVKAAGVEHVCLRASDPAYLGRAYFNLSTGTKGKLESPLLEHRMSYAGNGWWRCSVTYLQPATTTSAGVEIQATDGQENVGYPGDGSDAVLLWGAQLELSGAATSHIPTTDAPSTRDGDDIYRNLGGEYRSTEGALVVNVTPRDISDQTTRMIDLVSSSQRLQLRQNGTRLNIISSGASGTFQVNLYSVFAWGQQTRLAVSFKTGELLIAANGSMIGRYAEYVHPTGLNILGLNAVDHGGSGLGQKSAAMHFDSCLYFPNTFTDSELEALTA